MSDRQLVSATHHPTQLMPVYYLSCSCGFEGTVNVSVESQGDDVVEKAKCPNCKSPTVHRDHVTKKATTIEHYSDNTHETKVAQDEVQVESKAVGAAASVDDVTKAVLAHPLFTRLASFMDEQDSKKAKANGKKKESKTEGGN